MKALRFALALAALAVGPLGAGAGLDNPPNAARTSAVEPTASPAPLRVPEGFVVERVAAPPQVRFPMFGAFDELGRLYITESGGGDLYEDLLQQKRTCRVSLLEDRDGDGRFEEAHVFARSFVPSMGIVWRGRKPTSRTPGSGDARRFER
jgi:hypothetical protein